MDDEPPPVPPHDDGCAYAAEPDTGTCDCSVRDYWKRRRDAAASVAFGAMMRGVSFT